MKKELIAIVSQHGEWMLQVFIALFFTWLISISLQRILKRVADHYNAEKTTWQKVLIKTIYAPLRVFVWVGGITIALYVINQRFNIPIIKTALGFQPVIHIAIVGWFLFRFKSNFFKTVTLEYRKVTASTADTLEKISTIIIIAALAFLLLPNLGISINGLLAFGGIGGVVVGFAAKDMLANFFGAIMLHFDRPFAIGDWVNLPEKDIQGDVEHIGWRQVAIRTFDKRLVFIPNYMFGNLILMNPSRMTHRRIHEFIGIRYDDIKKLPEILKDIREYLRENKDIDQAAGVVANFDKYSAYSVDMVISAYSRQTAWAGFLNIKEQVMLKINDIIVSHGAEIAFPNHVVQLKQ